MAGERGLVLVLPRAIGVEWMKRRVELRMILFRERVMAMEGGGDAAEAGLCHTGIKVYRRMH